MYRVTFWPCEIAALVGKNKYVAADEALRRAYRRYNPAYQGGQDAVTLAAENATLVEVETLVQAAPEFEAPPAITEHNRSAVARQVIDHMSNTKQPRVLDGVSAPVAAVIQQQTNVKCGLKNEGPALDQFEREFDQPVVQRNNTLHKMKIAHISPYDFFVAGRVDGLLADGTPVETKDRQNRMFPGIPLYEKVQMEVYMRLLGRRQCQHIQRFAGSIDATMYQTDDRLMLDIRTQLQAVCRDFIQLDKDWLGGGRA